MIHKDADRIMADHLGGPRGRGAISEEDYAACAREVDRFVRADMHAHADHHALRVRTDLGPPWSQRAKNEVYNEIQSVTWKYP